MYKYVQVVPKVMRLDELLAEGNAIGVHKEYELAMMAPKMVEVLKQAQKALLFSRPVGTITPEVEAAHVAAHQAVCDVLMSLNELH